MWLNVAIVFVAAASLSLVVYVVGLFAVNVGLALFRGDLCGCLLVLLAVCFDFSLVGFSLLDLTYCSRFGVVECFAF